MACHIIAILIAWGLCYSASVTSMSAWSIPRTSSTLASELHINDLELSGYLLPLIQIDWLSSRSFICLLKSNLRSGQPLLRWPTVLSIAEFLTRNFKTRLFCFQGRQQGFTSKVPHEIAKQFTLYKAALQIIQVLQVRCLKKLIQNWKTEGQRCLSYLSRPVSFAFLHQIWFYCIAEGCTFYKVYWTTDSFNCKGDSINSIARAIARKCF